MLTYIQITGRSNHKNCEYENIPLEDLENDQEDAPENLAYITYEVSDIGSQQPLVL